MGWTVTYKGKGGKQEQLTLEAESREAVGRELASRGITDGTLHTVRECTTYERACREGRAPQPTNDVQKASWEKVHQIPDKLMTMEFDHKSDQ